MTQQVHMSLKEDNGYLHRRMATERLKWLHFQELHRGDSQMTE